MEYELVISIASAAGFLTAIAAFIKAIRLLSEELRNWRKPRVTTTNEDG